MLETIQTQFFEALRLPLRGTSRRSTELPPCTEGHSARFFAIADAIIQPGPELSAAERLELYHRQYWFRLLDSLAEDFPTLQACMGSDLFWRDAERYLLHRSSSSFTLRHLGEGLADFFANDCETPAHLRGWLADLARLEYTHMEVFEQAQACIPDERTIMEAQLMLQAHVRLVRIDHPVDLYWNDPSNFALAADRGEAQHQALEMAVWRSLSGESFHRRIDAEESQLLALLQLGGTLPEILSRLSEPVPSPELIRNAFGRWQQDGWIGIRGSSMNLPISSQRHWHGMDRMSSETRAMND